MSQAQRCLSFISPDLLTIVDVPEEAVVYEEMLRRLPGTARRMQEHLLPGRDWRHGSVDGAPLSGSSCCCMTMPFAPTDLIPHIPPVSQVPPAPCDPSAIGAEQPNHAQSGPDSGVWPGEEIGSVPVGGAIKRLFDLLGIAAACILLLALAPLLCPLIIAVAADGGPVLFRQSRIGFGGRVFPCFKFRTMMVNAEQALAAHLARDAEAAAEWARDHKLRNDPRITAVGRFLRKTSLDELPQLLNVLRGNMSLVGPRPIVSAEIVRYGDYFADYCRARPGITGLWQVSGRNDVDYPTRVRLDSTYVRNWSLWWDIKIIARTIPALLTSRGAH